VRDLPGMRRTGQRARRRRDTASRRRPAGPRHLRGLWPGCRGGVRRGADREVKSSCSGCPRGEQRRISRRSATWWPWNLPAQLAGTGQRRRLDCVTVAGALW
jgi:hypothetical protein